MAVLTPPPLTGSLGWRCAGRALGGGERSGLGNRARSKSRTAGEVAGRTSGSRWHWPGVRRCGPLHGQTERRHLEKHAAAELPPTPPPATRPLHLSSSRAKREGRGGVGCWMMTWQQAYHNEFEEKHVLYLSMYKL